MCRKKINKKLLELLYATDVYGQVISLMDKLKQ